MSKNIVNFLIVGAAKSGTTSIYNYLMQHPEIYMPEHKEPHYFVNADVKNKVENIVDDFEEYLTLFPKLNQIQGEASVFYLLYYKNAIKNIKKMIGNNVKIIIVLRNPIERAFSAYRYTKKAGKELYSFEEALMLEEKRKYTNLTPMMQYRECSMYYSQVKEFMENFENVHVIIFEDFIKDEQLYLKNLCDFLKINNSFIFDTSHVYNANDKDWKYDIKYIKFFLIDNKFKLFIKNSLEKFPTLFRIIKNFYQKIFFSDENMKLSMDNRKTMLTSFEDDIVKLEKLLNKNLSHWRK